MPDVDLLRARYVRKTFVRHTHESFVIAGITKGVEAFHHHGTIERAGPGAVALINPDTAHTGHAGVPEGWTYSVLYPGADIVASVAAETTAIRGTAGFAVAVAEDPYAVHLVTQVLRATDQANALAADTMMRLAIARLLRAHGGTLPQRTRSPRAPAAPSAPGRSWRRASPTRRRWPSSRQNSAPAPSRCCAASATSTACRRTPGSPTPGSAARGACWTAGRLRPRSRSRWASPTSPI